VTNSKLSDLVTDNSSSLNLDFVSSTQGVSSSGRDFASSGRDFASSGREFASSGRDFASSGRDFASSGRDFASSDNKQDFDTPSEEQNIDKTEEEQGYEDIIHNSDLYKRCKYFEKLILKNVCKFKLYQPTLFEYADMYTTSDDWVESLPPNQQRCPDLQCSETNISSKISKQRDNIKHIKTKNRTSIGGTHHFQLSLEQKTTLLDTMMHLEYENGENIKDVFERNIDVGYYKHLNYKIIPFDELEHIYKNGLHHNDETYKDDIYTI
jgi:hypothetical protein